MSYSVRINGSESLSEQEKMLLFLGHYDLRIYVSDLAYVDVGAGSLGCFFRLSLIPDKWATGRLATIGRWCEFSSTSAVLLAGEHRHDQPINIGFTTFRVFDESRTNIGLKLSEPLEIGHGVVISDRAIILPGRKIGDGAVVGAGAVVTRDVEALAIVAGSPARVIGARQPFLPWWDFSAGYIARNMASIEALAKTKGPHEWRIERPRFVIRARNREYSVEGFVDGEGVAPIGTAPEGVKAYLAHVFGETPPVTWMADCWAE